MIIVQLFVEHLECSRIAVLKVWSQKPFQGVWKVRTIFVTIPGGYLPFSLSFSHKYAVEFSSNFIMSDIALAEYRADLRMQLPSSRPEVKEICKVAE